MSVGRRIDLLLKEKGMTRKELSEKSGISEAAICRYINGSRQPKTVCLNSIARALDTPIEQLTGIEAFPISDLDDVVKFIARNADEISPEQKRSIINALIGD